jgi:hypothetical protein
MAWFAIRKAVCDRAVGAFLVLLMGFVVANPGAVRANPITVDGKDSRDGSAITGFRLQSENKQAFLYFLCDADEENPKLWVSHGEIIGESTEPFRIAYSIDGGPLQIHWFYVLPNLKSGAFFPRYNQMYEERFGPTPEMFDKQAGSVSPLYVDWYDNLYNSIIRDFGFGGDAALFKLTDKKGQDFSYLFNIITLPDFMPRLKDCYESPRNYVPVAPTQ